MTLIFTTSSKKTVLKSNSWKSEDKQAHMKTDCR